MRKNILLILLISCLLAGCAKNNKLTEEYLNSMTDLRNKLGDYTVEAIISSKGSNGYYKSYVKGDLWKTEGSENNGQTYKGTILYDGNEVFAYSAGTPLAVSVYLKKSFDIRGMYDKEKADRLMMMVNPLGVLFYWSIDSQTGKANHNWELGQTTKRNNFDCRMFKNTKDKREVCVSDKYGIAVYAKFPDKTKNDIIEINVKNINNKTLTSADVGLPVGIKKISMSDLLQNMIKVEKQ